jgi:hypothetical protein
VPIKDRREKTALALIFIDPLQDDTEGRTAD